MSTAQARPAEREFRPGRALRPIDWTTYRRIARSPWVLYLLSALAGVPLVATPAARGVMAHPAVLVVGEIVTFAIGVLIFVGIEVRPGLVFTYPATLTLSSILAAGVLTSVALAAFGPHFGFVAVIYPLPVIFAVILLRATYAVLVVTAVAVEAALVVTLQPGWVAPLGQWAFVVAATVGVSVLAGTLTARLIAATAAEHAARVELADLNATLNDRVATQVTELERTGGRLRAAGATVGGLAGDGVMAWFNDPVPCAQPGRVAVMVAGEIRRNLRPIVLGWRRRGYDLGFGIGVACGHATLGVVGFEGREDYTALGTVVNLAARLCAAATADQILLDPRTVDELDDAVPLDPVEGLTLKGLPAETRIHAVR